MHEALGTVGSGEGLDVCNLYPAREEAVDVIRTLPLRPPPFRVSCLCVTCIGGAMKDTSNQCIGHMDETHNMVPEFGHPHITLNQVAYVFWITLYWIN